MMDSNTSRVHAVMDHVRANAGADLSLEALAKVANTSQYHFHRMFRGVTGETLTQFVQRTRLERAAYLMKASPDRSLASIAHEVGFSEQSDFSRVFRSHYGIAPSHWDRRCRIHPVGLANFKSELAKVKSDGPPPTVNLVERPARRLAYVRVRAPFVGPAMHAGYGRLTSWLTTSAVDWRSRELVGLSWDNYETTPIDLVNYDLGFTVPDDLQADGEFGIHVLPAMKSAEVHCVGPLSRIAVAWDHLYDGWLPSSVFEPDAFPGLKRFRQRPDELGWETYDLDACLSIRPRVG